MLFYTFLISEIMNFILRKLLSVFFILCCCACVTQIEEVEDGSQKLDSITKVSNIAKNINGFTTFLWANEVFIELSRISNFYFDKNGGLDISNYQPWKGYSQVADEGNTHKITIWAGRKKSESVAKWFRKNLKNGDAIGCKALSLLPVELNFSLKGSITFDYKGRQYKADNILLAQGNNEFRNNWWIGSVNAVRYYDSSIKPVLIQQAYCTTESELFITLRIEEIQSKSAVNAFKMSVISG